MANDAKTRRKHLKDYSNAHRDIELTEAAINILEHVSTARSVVTTLKRKQHIHLRRLDAAAAKLGAPYGVHNVEHNRRTAASSPGVRVDGPVGPLVEE